MTTYSTPHNLPILESSDKIAATTDSLRQDINDLSNATSLALTAEGQRAEAAAKWKREDIASGTDLDSYYGSESAGYYSSLLTSVTATLTNLPQELIDNPTPFNLTVMPLGDGVIHEIDTYSVYGTEKFVRNSAPSTGSGWTSWTKHGAGEFKHPDIDAGTNLNDIYGEGVDGTHASLVASTTATLLNLPPDLAAEPRAFVLFAKTLNDGTIQEIDTYYWPPRKYIRNSAPSSGTGWTAWRTFLMDGDVTSGGGAGASTGFKNVPLALTLPASSSTTETISAASLRFPLKYGAPTHRGALHIQNKNFRGDITYPGVVSFTGVWFGEGNHTTGAFTSAPVQVYGAFTTPANGDAMVLPWSNLLAMESGKDYLVSVGYTNAAGQSNTLSYGAVWRSSVPGNASVLAPAQTLGKEAPFNFWIEAETFGDTPTVATVSSSGGAGVGSTLAILESSLSITCRRLGALPIHYAHSGSTLSIWDDAEHIKWQQWLGQARPDAVILALGSNDVFGSDTLDEIKANFLEVTKIITETLTPNLYLTTIPPRSTADPDTKRVEFNTWMKTLPGGAKDIFDYSAVLTGTNGLLKPEYDADGTHTNTAGAEAVAATVTRPIIGHFTGTRSVPAAAGLPTASILNRGLMVFAVAENKHYYSNGTTWAPVSAGAQGNPGPPGAGVPAGGTALQMIQKNSSNTTTEWVTPTKALVGLTNVDNTSDLAKPVSTQQQAALDLKASSTHVHAAATPTVSGFMSGADKTRLDTVEYNGANIIPSNFGIPGGWAEDTANTPPGARVSYRSSSSRYLAGQSTTVIPIDETKTYRFSFDIHSDIVGQVTFIDANWKTKANAQIGTSPRFLSNYTIPTNSWTSISGYFGPNTAMVPPAGSAGINPYVYANHVNGAQGGNLTISDLRIVDVTEVVDLVRGASYLASTVLNGLQSAADKSKLDGAVSAATADAIARRDVNGHLALSQLTLTTQTSAWHATRKDYVDAQVATRAASSHTHAAGDINSGVFTESRLPPHLALATLNSAYIQRLGTRGVTKTIYVRATGNDANDGSSSALAFREIRTAVSSLSAMAPVFRGSIVIDVGAGTYKGGIQFPSTRHPAQDDYIKIKGPAVGHPNVPTVIIDKAADTSATYGILGENGVYLWVEDIKILGAFSNGLDMRRGSAIQRRNVHVEGAGVGVSLNSGCFDYAYGGITSNCTQSGVAEMFNIVRSYDAAGSVAAGHIIRNCPVGLDSKAGGQGHADYLTVEDCPIGVQLDRSSANVGNLTLKRNQIGLALKDAEIHSEDGVIWGTGADANVRRRISHGPASSESGLWGWTNGPLGLRTGLRPPICIGNEYTDVVHTGTLTRTTVFTFANVLPMDVYTIKGKKLFVNLVGSCTSATTAAHTLHLTIAGGTVLTLTLPSGLASGTHFKAEWELDCSADGNFQEITGTLTAGTNVSQFNYAATTLDLTTIARSVFVQVQLGATADTVTLRKCEVLG